jgi:hypothetical protein
MADKNQKRLGEYIEISIPAYGKDQTARIWREDVRNDAQWEHIKQEATSSGTLITAAKSYAAKPGDGAETLDLTDPITGAKAKMPRGNLSQARWDALKKRDPAENQILWDAQKDVIEASPSSIKRTVISPDGSREVSYQAAPRRLPEAGDLGVNDLVDRSGGRTGDRLPRVGDPGVDDLVDRSGGRAGDRLPRVGDPGVNDLVDRSGGRTGGASEFVPRGAGVTLSVDEGLDTERPVQKPMLTNPSTRTLSVDEQASAGGTMGGKLRGVLGDMAQGALPGPPGMGTPPGPIPEGQGSLLEDPRTMAERGAHPQPAPVPSGAGGGSPGAGMPTPYPGDVPGPVNVGGVNDVRQMGADLLGPSPGAQMADLQAQSATKQPLLPPPAPDGKVPGSESLKTQQTATTRVPGSGGSSLEGDLNKSYADAVKAKAEMARMEAENSGKIAEAEIIRQKNLQNIEDARAARAQALVERQDKVQAAQMRAVESLSEQVKIDPGRLWASRTAQQKADAQLAGFLFGFSGSGAQYVQSLQNEVDKDVQAQLQAAQLTMEGKKAQVAGLGNIFTQLRQQGLDTNEAASVARASMLEIHNSKLTEMEARFKGTTAGVRASEAIAALGPARVKAISDYRTAAAQQASLYSAMRVNELEAQTRAATALMKTKEETPMQATLSKEMAGLEDVRASLLNMKSMAGGGMYERLRTQGADVSPFGGVLDPDRKAKARTFKGEAYAQMIEKAKGALQAGELAALSQIVPQNISVVEDPGPYFDRAIAFVEQQLARRQERYSKSGADTRGPSAGGQGGAR